jgi:hypothetical protein
MSATYNPVSKEKEEGNRLGYYYNEDNLPFTKVDYLNIKNPKIIDVYGHGWNNIHEKRYYEINDKLNRFIDRLSDDIFLFNDGEYDSKSNFNNIIYSIVHVFSAE